MAESDVFWIGDRLPTAYDVALTINFYSKRIKTDLRSRTTSRYVHALRDIWVRSFGEDHVCALSVIRNKNEFGHRSQLDPIEFGTRHGFRWISLNQKEDESILRRKYQIYST